MARRLQPLEIAEAYMTAKEWVIQRGFHAEIDWQSEVSPAIISEQTFLQEAAWVVLSAGFRESVLRSKFPRISEAFLGWGSAAEITENRSTCRRQALRAFNHKGKIRAILDIAGVVHREGFQRIKEHLLTRPLDFIRTLPYLGPVTCFHLAKNLGLPVAKPDRHLVRIAKASGYESVQDLCATVGAIIGDNISVVDLVFWRFATLNPHYETAFARLVSTEKTPPGQRQDPGLQRCPAG
jgi:hypothetical protein